MNKQTPGIEWTHVWGRPGYTWNVAAGCRHYCQWVMPDGTLIRCYAEGVAEGVARKAYPEGFAHSYWHPERLEEPLKLREPAGIFLDSMSDLMGVWVRKPQIEAVLDVCRRTPQHVYFLLTKNAPRLLQFDFPPNVWVGVSMPPSFMNGRRLEQHQQVRMLWKGLEVLQNLSFEKGLVTWTSFEPLSWDVSGYVAAFPSALDWAVIGAASNGQRLYQPEFYDVKSLVDVLDEMQVPMFFKGNLRGCPAAEAVGWREDYPVEASPPALKGIPPNQKHDLGGVDA